MQRMALSTARSARRILVMACVLVAPALLAVASAAAAKPEKLFPEFKAQKDSLGAIAMLVDVVVVEDVIGKTEKIYLDDCRELGQSLIETLVAGMEPKGYTFGRRTLVSVGNVVDPKLKYRVLRTWEQHTQNDTLFPVAAPPFYADSALAAGTDAQESWKSVLNGAWGFEIRKNRPTPVLTEIAGLREAIGSDHALVVVVVGTKIPFGKQFGQGLLSGFTKAPVASSGSTTFYAGVDFTQYSGTGIKVAMVDCRDGRVLWSDGDHEAKSIKKDDLEKLAKDVLKRLP